MKTQYNVLEYLENAAARQPEKLAFSDGKRSFTFGEFLCVTQRIGSAVLPFKGRFAVVLTDRTALSVAGFFGAMQAGLCYVPLDVKMPTPRMEAILCSLKPAVILYAARDVKKAAELQALAPILELEAAMETPADTVGLAARRAKVLDIDPAYMIYTSGSTGTPKGILISHRSVIDFTDWMSEACGTQESEVFANQAPFYFDLSVKDLYQTLKCGCSTHILPQTVFMFPKLLIDALNTHHVTTLNWATSAFRITANSGIFEKYVPTDISKVVLGGEALQAKHLSIWQEALPNCRFINLYGPTEVTVDCTMFEIQRRYADDERIPIGKPCRNMDVILLDEELQPVKDGEAGEICVRGAGLAIGYFASAEKNEAAFIQNPLCPDYPDRLYRTGDIARWNEDGDLIYLQRRDGQIKHMGYRIELGEIESVLTALDGVNQAICFYDSERERIVCCAETKLTAAELTAAVHERLQKYMTPNVWYPMERLPLNPNGKVDRPALRRKYEEDQA